jgi:hypothetical protein
LKKTEAYMEALAPMFRDRNAKELADYLIANSNLPGPRGNLELASALGRVIAGFPEEEWLRSAITSWCHVGGEYLAFCGTLACGVIYSIWHSPVRNEREIMDLIIAGARDSRWRVREAAAMALQLIGEHDKSHLARIVGELIMRGDLLLDRMVIAGLAHPPILHDAGLVSLCMSTSDILLERVSSQDASSRKTEPFRVLQKALGYALSVFVVASPSEGLRLLARWAKSDDRDVRRIILENLKHKRLESRFPEEVQGMRRDYFATAAPKLGVDTPFGVC